MPLPNETFDVQDDNDLLNSNGTNATGVDLADLPADGSSTSLRSPSLILQALIPLVLSICLFAFGRKLYRFTTSVSVGISFSLLVWAIFINLETGVTIAGWNDEVAALTVWSTMIGAGLLGCLLGFQPKWWGAHVTGRLCLGANAGLGLSFSILLLKSGLLIRRPAAHWPFISVLSILGVICVLYDHFLGPSLTIALEAAFLLFLGLDLFINKANKGAAIGLRLLLDHNPNHSAYKVEYILQKTTWTLITVSWLTGIIFVLINCKFHVPKPFGPLVPSEEQDEEKGFEKRESTVDIYNDQAKGLDHKNKSSHELDNGNSTSVDKNHPLSQLKTVVEKNLIRCPQSRVLVASSSPPEFGTSPALALSPTVYSRYRRTPDPGSPQPGRTPIQYCPQRSNLSNFYQLRRVETVDEVTEVGTSVGEGESAVQSSILLQNDGSERMARGTSLNEDYLNAVMRLAAGDDNSCHVVERREEDEKEETRVEGTKPKEYQSLPVPLFEEPVNDKKLENEQNEDGLINADQKTVFSGLQIESSANNQCGTARSPKPDSNGSDLAENKSNDRDLPFHPVAPSSESSRCPSFEFNKLFKSLPKKSSQSSMGKGLRSIGSARTATIREEEDDDDGSLAGTESSKASGSLLSRIPLPSGLSEGGRSRGLKSTTSSSTDLISRQRHSRRHSRVKHTNSSNASHYNRASKGNRSLRSLASFETKSSLQDRLSTLAKPEPGERNPLLWSSTKTTQSLKSCDSGNSSMIDSFLQGGTEGSVPTTPSISGKPFVIEDVPQEIDKLESIGTTEELAHSNHPANRVTPENFSEKDVYCYNDENENETAFTARSSRRTTAIPHTPTLGNMLLRVGGNEVSYNEQSNLKENFGQISTSGHNVDSALEGDKTVQNDDLWADNTDESDRMTVRTPPSNRSTVCMTSNDHRDHTSAEDGGRSSSGSEDEYNGSQEMYLHPIHLGRLNQALEGWEQTVKIDLEATRNFSGNSSSNSNQVANNSRSPSLHSIPIPSQNCEIVGSFGSSTQEMVTSASNSSAMNSRPFVGVPLKEVPWPQAQTLKQGPFSGSPLQESSNFSKRKRWTSNSSIYPPLANESSFSSSVNKFVALENEIHNPTNQYNNLNHQKINDNMLRSESVETSFEESYQKDGFCSAASEIENNDEDEDDDDKNGREIKNFFKGKNLDPEDCHQNMMTTDDDDDDNQEFHSLNRKDLNAINLSPRYHSSLGNDVNNQKIVQSQQEGISGGYVTAEDEKQSVRHKKK
ncbi:hypothetical protein BY996DRAFT_4585569 [Phakopsora pachyrhizi]|nr:hypothetical protein BY996DRAFT_4585569 [Phakopsora pachyrhizi]